MKKYIFESPGLIDYSMRVSIAGRIIPIFFEGGSLSSFGITPARFGTDDPVTATAIRLSPESCKGIIREWKSR